MKGDGDPLDICILTEKTISAGNFLARCRPIGGLRMLDANEADDKIIAVLEGDLAFGEIRDLSQVQKPLVLKSPIDGTISAVFHRNEERVMAGTTILAVVPKPGAVVGTARGDRPGVEGPGAAAHEGRRAFRSGRHGLRVVLP